MCLLEGKTFIQVCYVHYVPKMQLVSFNVLEDFNRKYGSMDNSEYEN